MTLEDFEFTDAKILDTIIDINSKKIIFHFETAYEVQNRKFTSNVKVIVSEWEKLNVYKYVSFDNYKTYEKVDLFMNDLETFNLIQLKQTVGDKLIFEGYSKESSCWLVYEFIRCVSKVIIGNVSDQR